MTPAVTTPLPAIDENLFCQLLEGSGKVRVDIVRLEQYFAPFVSFFADSEAAPVRYGVLLHGRWDLLAARTVPELIVLLRDIAGDTDSLTICLPSSPAMDMTARLQSCI
jgi:hypothetical protein